MANLGVIFSSVSRGSTLALDLYKIATEQGSAGHDLSRVAKSISKFSSAVKQVGTIIKEDDSLPSAEAIETLEDLLDQCNHVLAEIESLAKDYSTDPRKNVSHQGSSQESPQPSNSTTHRMHYLRAHLNALKATVSVMQQTLYTAQSIKWAQLRPWISPQQADAATGNERTQLESLVIEQQMSILSAIRLYEPANLDARLLMDKDSSMSLVARNTISSKPTDLYRYQERFLTSLDTTESNESEWLPAVCGIAKSHLERLLEKWTRLRQFNEKISDEEWKRDTEKKYTQQPTVDSDDEEDIVQGLGVNDARLMTPTPQRPGGVQPLFSHTAFLPPPTPKGRPRSTSPASSYGASPRSSINSLASTNPTDYSPVSPRTSITSLPVEAAAAVEAKDQDNDLDLEIPWTVCTRKHYWKYVDGKIKSSNTDLPSSSAFSDRHSWTEIPASWVCAEAIKEARYKYTQVQKERHDGRRTKLETSFCIERPLTFDEVQRLVERTVELYRQKKPPSPQPSSRRTSFDRPSGRHSNRSSLDRDRTPLASQQQPPPPPLNRSTTGYPAQPPPPPPPPRGLDRTHSMPTGGPAFPTLNIASATSQAYLQVPGPGSPYTQQPRPPTYPAQPPLQSPSGIYPPPIFAQESPPKPYARGVPTTIPQSPLRQNHAHTHSHSSNARRSDDHHYSSASTTSDSDNAARSRSNKHRSRSRRSSNSHHGMHSTKGKKAGALGTIATVGGLAALLDGIVDLGVL